MISDNDIANAIGQQVAGLGYPIIWEGQEAAPGRPYLTFALVPGTSRNRSVTGKSPEHRGQVVVGVAVESGAGPQVATAARAIGEEIRALFMDALPFIVPITGGKVEVQNAQIKTGFADGVGYRVPVHIEYLAHE